MGLSENMDCQLVPHLKVRFCSNSCSETRTYHIAGYTIPPNNVTLK